MCKVQRLEIEMKTEEAEEKKVLQTFEKKKK